MTARFVARRILSTYGTGDHYRNETWEYRNIGKPSPSALGGAVTVTSGYTTTVAGVISCSYGDYYHTGLVPTSYKLALFCRYIH